MKRHFDDCPICSPVNDIVKFIRCDVTAYVGLSKYPEKSVYQENNYVVTPANFCPCCGRPMTPTGRKARTLDEA